MDDSKAVEPNWEIFRHFTGTYLGAERFEFARLKEAILRNPDKAWPAEYKAAWHAVIHEGAMTEREYYLLTHLDFDTPEEYKKWLEDVWAYLYEDGPDPI